MSFFFSTPINVAELILDGRIIEIDKSQSSMELILVKNI